MSVAKRRSLLGLIFSLLFAASAWAQEVSPSGQISYSQLPAPIFVNGVPSPPSGTVSTSPVMMGLGSTCTITPKATGIVQFTINSLIQNSVGSDGFAIQIAYGTGTAPVNGAAASGTQLGAGLAQATVPTAASVIGAPLTGIATGLTIGTAYWFDVQLRAITGGTETQTSVTCTANELH